MTEPGRIVLPPEHGQALARAMVFSHLRQDRRYQYITLQDLRPLWLALVRRHPTASSCELVILDEIQHGPHEAWRWRDAPPGFQHDIAEATELFGPDDPGYRAHQQAIADSEITACPELETYFHDLDAVVAEKLRLTGQKHASWWAMEAVHGDVLRAVVELEPGGDWVERHDPWLSPDPFSVHRRIDITASLYGAQVTCTDGTTGEPLWTETHAPRTLTFHDWEAVRDASDRCMQDVPATMAEHHRHEGLQRNLRTVERQMTEDLPALIEWHFHNKVPGLSADRKRLQRVAREQLGVDPLHAKKQRAKMANFLASKREKGRYGGDEA